jgi:hypothetical protein
MAAPDLPQTDVEDGDARRLAALLDLALPPECEPGVAQNLKLLAEHATTVRKALSAG